VPDSIITVLWQSASSLSINSFQFPFVPLHFPGTNAYTKKSAELSSTRACAEFTSFESSFGASLPVGHEATTAIHLEVLDFRSSLVQIACVPGFRNRLRRGLRLLGEIHSICSTALLPEVLDLLKYAHELLSIGSNRFSIFCRDVLLQAKDPDERWQSARDLKDELEWIASASSEATTVPTTVVTRHSLLPWIAAAATLAVGAGGGLLLHHSPSADTQLLRFEIDPPEEGKFASDAQRNGMALSPDGAKLAYVASGKDGINRLWIRTLNEPSVRLLSGTEDGQYPFWSPDGKTVAFFNTSKLRRAGQQPWNWKPNSSASERQSRSAPTSAIGRSHGWADGLATGFPFL
jgi:hypothetical protein